MVACAGQKRAPPARGVCWFIIWSKLFSLPGTYGRHRYRRGNLWQSLEDAPGKKTQNTVLKIMPLRWDWTGQKCASMLILDICEDFQEQRMQPWSLQNFHRWSDIEQFYSTEYTMMVRYWTDFTVQYRIHHVGQILNRLYSTEYTMLVRYWTDFTVESTPCWSDIEQILQYRVHHVGRRVRSSSRDKGPMMPKIKSI